MNFEKLAVFCLTLPFPKDMHQELFLIIYANIFRVKPDTKRRNLDIPVKTSLEMNLEGYHGVPLEMSFVQVPHNEQKYPIVDSCKFS